MQIIEAIDELKKVLGMACSGGGEDRSEVGESIIESVASIKPIRNFDSVKHSEVSGGEVTIAFSGNQQPEAARTLDSVIGDVLGSLGLSELDVDNKRNNKQRRSVANKENPESRIIMFLVPDDKAALFAEGVSKITQSLKNNSELQEQYGIGTSVAVALPDGIKPFVNIAIPKGYEMIDGKPVITPPHFDLRLQGVPEELAKKIATIIGKNPYTLQDSKPRESRDLKKTFTGGKDITIDLSKPESSEAIKAIRMFLDRIKSIPKPGSDSGRFGGGGG